MMLRVRGVGLLRVSKETPGSGCRLPSDYFSADPYQSLLHSCRSIKCTLKGLPLAKLMDSRAPPVLVLAHEKRLFRQRSCTSECSRVPYRF